MSFITDISQTLPAVPYSEEGPRGPSTLWNHSSTRRSQAAKLRFLFVGHRVTQQPWQWNLTQIMVKQCQKKRRTGGSLKPLRAARKLKEIEENSGIEVSEIRRRPDHAHLAEALQLISLSTRSGLQNFWREVFPLDFEMKEMKSMDRGKYYFFTCADANLSLPHIELEKQEHNRTLRTYFLLMSVSQRNLCSWFFSLRNNYLLIMRGAK